MSAEQDRQDYYKAYDRAVGLVRSEVKSVVELTTSSIDFKDGTVTLCDRRCNLLAVVDGDGNVSYPSKGRNAQAKPQNQSQPVPEFVSKRTFDYTVKRILQAVGRRIGHSDKELLGVTRSLAERVSSLETSTVSKSLDLEAYDAMAEMVGRIDRLEADMADMESSAFRYRGYWQQGKVAKRGDAYTHNGTIWWALRDTSETPDRDSADWHVAVRKGKDAK